MRTRTRVLVAASVVAAGCGGSKAPPVVATPAAKPVAVSADAGVPDAAPAVSIAPPVPPAATFPVTAPMPVVDSRAFVDVSINGTPFRLALLTSSFVGLDAASAAKVGTIQKPESGPERVAPVMIELGTLKVAGAAIVLPFEGLRDGIGFPQLDGAFGVQILGSTNVWSLDYANQKLEVLNGDTFDYKGTGHVLTYDDGPRKSQLLHATVDGEPLTLIVDLGFRGFINVFGAAVAAKKLDTKYPKHITAIADIGFGPPTPSTLVRATSTQIGDVTLAKQVLFLEKPAPSDQAPAVDGMLGSFFFSTFDRVIFDPAHHHIILEGAGTPTNRTDRAGLWFVPREAGLEIIDVVAKGPAAAAKLKVGDVITAFDGKPATAASAIEIRRELAAPKRTKATLTIKSGDKTRTVVLKLKDQL